MVGSGLNKYIQKKKKIFLKLNKFMEVKKKYVSLYHMHLTYLYDKGFITDPTHLDEREIRKYLSGEGISGLLTSKAGRVILNAANFEHAYLRNKRVWQNSEHEDFLYHCWKAYYFKACCSDLNFFFDECQYSLDEESKQITYSLKEAGASLYTKAGYNQTDGVLEMLIKNGYGIGYVDISEGLFRLACSVLGVEVIEEGGNFTQGMTLKDEIRTCKCVLNGDVIATGTYAKELNEWLSENTYTGNRTFQSGMGLYESLFATKVNEVYEMQCKAFEEVETLCESSEDRNIKVITVDSERIYYPIVQEGIEGVIGSYAVLIDDDEAEILPVRTLIGGYSGLCLSFKYCVENGIDFVGCPIVLQREVGGVIEDFLAVDFEQTNLCKDEVSWWKLHPEADIEFKSDKTYYPMKVKDGSLEECLLEAWNLAECGELTYKIEGSADLTALEKAKDKVANFIQGELNEG